MNTVLCNTQLTPTCRSNFIGIYLSVPPKAFLYYSVKPQSFFIAANSSEVSAQNLLNPNAPFTNTNSSNIMAEVKQSSQVVNSTNWSSQTTVGTSGMKSILQNTMAKVAGLKNDIAVLRRIQEATNAQQQQTAKEFLQKTTVRLFFWFKHMTARYRYRHSNS